MHADLINQLTNRYLRGANMPRHPSDDNEHKANDNFFAQWLDGGGGTRTQNTHAHMRSSHTESHTLCFLSFTTPAQETIAISGIFIKASCSCHVYLDSCYLQRWTIAPSEIAMCANKQLLKINAIDLSICAFHRPMFRYCNAFRYYLCQNVHIKWKMKKKIGFGNNLRWT